MRKIMSAILAVVLLLSLSGCGGNGETYDAKLCFPDNSSLKLSATKAEIIEAQNLKLGSTGNEYVEYEKYVPEEDSLTEIGGIKLSSSYMFNDDDLLSYVTYSTLDAISFEPISVEFEEESSLIQVFEILTKHLTSIYGQPKEHSLNDQSGYYWEVEDSDGGRFKVTVFTVKYSFKDTITSTAVEVIRQ